MQSNIKSLSCYYTILKRKNKLCLYHIPLILKNGKYDSTSQVHKRENRRHHGTSHAFSTRGFSK